MKKGHQYSRHFVTTLFDRISSRYDRTNRVLSLGMDHLWRRAVAKALPNRSDLIAVDLATGTCDQIIALSKSPQITHFYGFDLSEKMLKIGKEKISIKGLSKHVTLQIGNALSVPLSAASCDVTTISFGIRNTTDPLRCLQEMHRILKPKGKAFVLEFSLPTSRWIRMPYLFYLRRILPKLGAWVGKDKDAYRYLNETIETFPSGNEFLSLMKEAGFTQPHSRRFTLGAVSLYVATKS